VRPNRWNSQQRGVALEEKLKTAMQNCAERKRQVEFLQSLQGNKDILQTQSFGSKAYNVIELLRRQGEDKSIVFSRWKEVRFNLVIREPDSSRT